MKSSTVLDQITAGLQAKLNRPFARGIPPRYINYLVTLRCNLTCPFCDIHTDARFTTRTAPELTPAELETAFSDPLLRKVAVIRISGGEPFMRLDLGEVLLAFGNTIKPSLLHITTNGSFPERIAPALKAALDSGARLHVQVSLDAIGSRLDKLRKCEGLSYRCLESLKELAALRRAYNFYVGINQTLTSATIDAVPAVQALARSYGFGYKVTAATYYNELTKVDHNPRLSALPFRFHASVLPRDYARVFTIYKRLWSDQASYAPRYWDSLLWKLAENCFLTGQYQRIVHERAAPLIQCTALFTHFRLMPNGDVVACNPLCDAPIGNLRDQSFTAVWSGESAREGRITVKQCRGCWLECDIGPSLFYSLAIARWGAAKLLSIY